MKNEKIRHIGNLVKSTILRKKAKTLSIAAILILSLSSAMTLTSVYGQIIYGQNPNAGITIQAATKPGELVQFGGGIEIVEPTPEQLAQYNLQSLPPNLIFTIAPNPVGVGQTFQIIYGLTVIPPVVTGYVNGVSTGVYGGWGAFQIILKDDTTGATVFTLNPPDTLTATSGSATVTWTPTAAGSYTVTVNWLGEIVANNTLTTMRYFNNYFSPVSRSQNFTVQQQPITGYVEAPIPTKTQYWTMPINAQNRAWNILNGPWLCASYNASGKFNPYTYAPESAHILWYQYPGPTQGGNVGGDYGAMNFKDWDMHPSGSWAGYQLPVDHLEVVNGYAYYNSYNTYPYGSSTTNYQPSSTSYIICQNIFTGEIKWKVPGAENIMQIMAFVSANAKIPNAILWYINGATWHAYNTQDGTEMFKVANCTGPTIDSSSSNLHLLCNGPVYPTSNTEYGYNGGGDLWVFNSGSNSSATGTWITKWSANKFLDTLTLNLPQWNWPDQPAVGRSYPWISGLVYNVTSISYPGASIGEIGTLSNGDPCLLCIAKSRGDINPVNSHYTEAYPWTSQLWGINATDGAFLWRSLYGCAPYSDAGLEVNNIQLANKGVFTMYVADNGTLCGYSEDTGQELWTTEIASNDWGHVSMTGAYGYQGQNQVAADGMLYIGLLDGHMHAVNMTTGEQVWDFACQPGGLQMPNPNYPISANDGYGWIPTLAMGELFFTTGKEHENNPFYQEHVLHVLNITDGKELWNATGQWGVEAIADGVLLGMDPYDGMFAAICRGPTQTTVSAPQTEITAGHQVVIQGTVTDQSPALKDTPAMADSCMTQWMAYKLKDQPFPSNAQGVPITITAIDPNGNYVSIGNTTSDTHGLYSYVWTPPDIPGKYTLVAIMAATNSYYSSDAETSAIVVSPTGATAPTATPTSVADTYFMPAISGIIVVIIVGFAVLALLMLRKRP